MTTAYLSARQRAKPPISQNPDVLRLGHSLPGVDVADGVRVGDPGLGTELARYPGDLFDRGISRDRSPYWERPRYRAAGESWLSWSAAGPAPAQLHMRQASYRREVGVTSGRFPTVDSPTGGLHTPIPNATHTVARYVETEQMMPGRMDRISPARYTGQTYSQGTVLQGGSR